MPASMQAASAGIPTGNVVANTTGNGAMIYRPAAGATLAGMSPAAVEPVGSSQPHENRMPYLAMSYIIAVEGIFPSRN
jgi:microcystin-dependent protein